MFKSRQSRALVLPLLSTRQRKSPQTLEIYSIAIPQLAFEIQPDFKTVSENVPPTQQLPSIRGAVAKELSAFPP